MKLSALLAVSLGLAVEEDGGGIGAEEADSVAAVVAFELGDVGLAGGDLAAGGGGGAGALLGGQTDVVELGVEFGAGAGDPTREEVGAGESGVALSDLVVVGDLGGRVG